MTCQISEADDQGRILLLSTTERESWAASSCSTRSHRSDHWNGFYYSQCQHCHRPESSEGPAPRSPGFYCLRWWRRAQYRWFGRGIEPRRRVDTTKSGSKPGPPRFFQLHVLVSVYIWLLSFYTSARDKGMSYSYVGCDVVHTATRRASAKQFGASPLWRPTLPI